MKMKIKTFVALLSAIMILFGAQFRGFSQEADTIVISRPGFYAGFSLGVAQSHLVNDGISSVSNQISNPMNALSGSAEFGYYFSKYFGLSTGIGLSSCNSEVTLNTYQSNFNAVDSESEAYQRQVTGTGIREQEKITFLTVPVCLNFRIPLNKTVGLFMQTGVAIAVPLVKNYISSGIFSYKGYYPAYKSFSKICLLMVFPLMSIVSLTASWSLNRLTLMRLSMLDLIFLFRKRFNLLWLYLIISHFQQFRPIHHRINSSSRRMQVR